MPYWLDRCGHWGVLTPASIDARWVKLSWVHCWTVTRWHVTSWLCDEMTVTNRPCDELVMWRVDWQPFSRLSTVRVGIRASIRIRVSLVSVIGWGQNFLMSVETWEWVELCLELDASVNPNHPNHPSIQSSVGFPTCSHSLNFTQWALSRLSNLSVLL